MRRFRVPNKSRITERSLRELYRRVRESVGLNKDTSLSSIRRRTIDAFERFFLKLGKPLYQFQEILPDDPPEPDSFTKMTKDILNDVSLGYEESTALREMVIASNNYGAVRASELKRRADQVASLVGDLRVLTGQQAGELVVFSDNFADASKIDSVFPLENPRAEITPGFGTLMLKRTSTFSVPGSEIRVDVKPISPAGLTSQATRDNTERFYEGRFFAYLGQAEPEGGQFHFEETLDPGTTRQFTQAAMAVPQPDENGDFTKDDLKNFVVPGGFEARFLEQVQAGVYADKRGKKLVRFIQRRRAKLHRKDRELRRSALYFARNPEEGKVPTADVPITPENLVLVEKGASPDELQEGRQKMFDGNPGSYWQCEFARRTDVIQSFVDGKLENVVSANVSPDDLRNLARSREVDTADFEVEITMTLDAPQTLNWITIVPMLFDDGAWLEVTDVSTAPDLSSSFVPVESFVDRSSPAVLTDEANEELSLERTSFVLAPNRFSYRGVGVWPFAARQVKLVRVRLSQKTPAPAPYERLVLEANRSHRERPRPRGI